MGLDLILGKVNIKSRYPFLQYRDYLDVYSLHLLNGKIAMNRILETIRRIENDFSDLFFIHDDEFLTNWAKYPIYIVPLYDVELNYCDSNWIHTCDHCTIMCYHSMLCFAHMEISLHIKDPEEYVMLVW